MNILLTLLVATLAAFSSFLPSTGKVYDNSTRYSGSKRITSRGWLTIATIGLLIGITALQNWLNDQEQIAKAQTQKRSYDSSLFVMKSKFDSSNINTINSITKTQNETLGKYGFLLDSTERKLVKIVRDSSKTKVIQPDSPVVELCEDTGLAYDSTRTDLKHFKVSLCSHDASSTNFDIDTYIVTKDSSHNYNFISKERLMDKADKISKNGLIESGFSLSRNTEYTEIYLVMKGYYSNLDLTKKIPIDKVYVISKKINPFRYLTGISKIRVQNFLSTKTKDFTYKKI